MSREREAILQIATYFDHDAESLAEQGWDDLSEKCRAISQRLREIADEQYGKATECE